MELSSSPTNTVSLSQHESTRTTTSAEDSVANESAETLSSSPINTVRLPQHESTVTTTSAEDSPSRDELPKFYPHWRGRPLYGGNQEALAWALDTVGRSISFIGAGAFLSTALLHLAKEAAGCETEPPPGESEVPECEGRVYGIRPSSLLTTYTIVVGLVSSLLLPLMGAIVDFTRHRLRAGRLITWVYCALLVPQIFINSETWFAVAILTMIVAFLGWAQTMITYAYLPEIEKDLDRMNQLTTNFTVLQFTGMVVFLLIVTGIAWLMGITEDEVAMARLSQIIVVVVTTATLVYSWGFLFRPRPAMHSLPEGGSVWTAGFQQVLRTSRMIYRNYHALKWFLIAVAFADAAVQSLATIAITYLTDQLNFSGFENGIAILCMLVGSIPGGIIAGWSTRRLETPIISALMSVTLLFVNTLVAGLVLTEPGQQIETYIIALFWGAGTGWKWTTDRLLISTIIPCGQDAELMGIFLLAGQILTWIPPLIFTALNEIGVSQRIGIIALDFFYFVAGLAYLKMGRYKDAVEVAGRGGAIINQTGEESNSGDSKVEDISPAVEMTGRSSPAMNEDTEETDSADSKVVETSSTPNFP